MITTTPNKEEMVKLTLNDDSKMLGMFTIIKNKEGFVTNKGFILLKDVKKWTK